MAADVLAVAAFGVLPHPSRHAPCMALGTAIPASGGTTRAPAEVGPGLDRSEAGVAQHRLHRSGLVVAVFQQQPAAPAQVGAGLGVQSMPLAQGVKFDF